MGETTFSRSLYASASKSMGYNAGDKGVTRMAEQQAHSTGKLEPLVDPSGFGIIRLSLPRVEKIETDEGEKYKLLVGCPMPIETRVDTTGSMGGNVDVAMEILPEAFESFKKVLESYDIQVATGIFGDVCDRFVLCRPQFEMEASKIMHQLVMMVPERQGGDEPEDPDIGIFGGAYLCRHYINRIGLKGYDFTVTDAPGRGRIDEKELVRVYGEEVFDKVTENGHQFDRRGSIDLDDVWSALLDRAHAFVLQVENSQSAERFWGEHVGKERLVKLPNTKYLPHVQAVIIGLTEGTLALTEVVDFLKEMNMQQDLAEAVTESVSNIPIGAQSQLPNYEEIPVKGDLFDGKPDVWEDKYLWPVGHKAEVAQEEQDEEDEWL